jgi:hypothetical protein
MSGTDLLPVESAVVTVAVLQMKDMKGYEGSQDLYPIDPPHPMSLCRRSFHRDQRSREGSCTPHVMPRTQYHAGIEHNQLCLGLR